MPVDEPIEDKSLPIPEESPVIDPSSLTYDDLKKICADNNIGMGHIAGIPDAWKNSLLEEPEPIDQSQSLKSALNSFFRQFPKNTIKAYRNHWDTICQYFDPDGDQLLSEFMANSVGEINEKGREKGRACIRHNFVAHGRFGPIKCTLMPNEGTAPFTDF